MLAAVASPGSVAPLSKLLSVHHARSPADSRRALMLRKSPESRSIGASAPAVAAFQAAPRNSRFVSTRLTAREATRSGASTAIAAPFGR